MLTRRCFVQEGVCVPIALALADLGLKRIFNAAKAEQVEMAVVDAAAIARMVAANKRGSGGLRGGLTNLGSDFRPEPGPNGCGAGMTTLCTDRGQEDAHRASATLVAAQLSAAVPSSLNATLSGLPDQITRRQGAALRGPKLCVRRYVDY